jgi:hypothetical protein
MLIESYFVTLHATGTVEGGREELGRNTVIFSCNRRQGKQRLLSEPDTDSKLVAPCNAALALRHIGLYEQGKIVRYERRL